MHAIMIGRAFRNGLWTANSVVLQTLLQVRDVRAFGLSFQIVFKVYDSLVSFRY